MLSPQVLNRTLLQRQHLLARVPMGALAMSEHLLGLQAQDPLPPYLSLWSRIDGFDPAEVSDALVDRSAVRVLLMRGTIHLVTARDALELRPLVQGMLDKITRNSQASREAAGAPRDELGAALASSAPARSYPKKIFCARRGEKRQCYNATDVEAMFSAHGFEVFYPEDFSLAEQAMTFRQAEVVAGYAGSALFNLCLCDSAKPVVMMSQSSYHGRNEYMIASALGHELNVFWCEPDPGDTGHAWKAGYTFDFDSDGADLRKLLASL